MPSRARNYAAAIIAAGAIAVTAALAQWTQSSTNWLAVFIAVTAIASAFKFRLPGISGTYSANAVFVLVGVVFYTLPETVLTVLIGTLIQQFFRVKRRPTALQTAFNLANEGMSTVAAYAIPNILLAGVFHSYRPAVLLTAASTYFVVNTVIVSGILALLEGRRLNEVCREWYYWSFPYYLIGVGIVAVIPGGGHGFHPEAWVGLIPLAYLLHFFWAVPARRGMPESEDEDHLEFGSRIYLSAVIIAGIALTITGLMHWEVASVPRFAALLILSMVTATWKVRLPRMTGTISVSYSLALFAVAQLSFGEAALISAAGAFMQTVWRAKRRPQAVQVAFNCACFVISAAVAFSVCRLMMAPLTSKSIIVMLCLGASVLYVVNSVLVAVILCLLDNRPLFEIWQVCNFWVLPYYMVGATATAVMIATEHSVGWPAALSVIPILGLIWTSYKEHVSRVYLPARV